MRTMVGGQKCQHLVHTGHFRGPAPPGNRSLVFSTGGRSRNRGGYSNPGVTVGGTISIHWGPRFIAISAPVRSVKTSRAPRDSLCQVAGVTVPSSTTQAGPEPTSSYVHVSS